MNVSIFEMFNVMMTVILVVRSGLSDITYAYLLENFRCIKVTDQGLQFVLRKCSLLQSLNLYALSRYFSPFVDVIIC